MVELKGTEKQIAWAEKIRNIFMEVCNKYDFKYHIEKYIDSEKAETWINNFKALSYENNFNKIEDMQYSEWFMAKEKGDMEHYEKILFLEIE